MTENQLNALIAFIKEQSDYAAIKAATDSGGEAIKSEAKKAEIELREAFFPALSGSR